MFKFKAQSDKFCIICSKCGHVMPLENMLIISSFEQFIAPCVEITCTECDKKDYIICKHRWNK